MAKKLLQGRLSKPASKFTQEFTASHQFDRRLYQEDIAVSLAHIKMLHKIGLLNAKEHSKLAKGLKAVETKIDKGKLRWSDELEDIHMHIEAQLIKDLGMLGKKLHLGRSRNDQVATDIRIYLRRRVDEICALMLQLRLALAECALQEADTLMPGFTHLQPAQPISCGHHLMAWYAMLERDYERFIDCRKRINQMPLGSAALAGTSFPVDRNFLAKELGFARPMDNSLDAVSSRDFIIECLAAIAITMQHLSRWSEELIIWNTNQFGFVELADEICTGSSIMPQKKNPDIPELVRGKSGRVFGNLVAMLTVMKGQTLAYNKDNQEDKELLFDSVDAVRSCLQAWIIIMQGIKFNADRMLAALELGYVNATCVADYLAGKQIPFREAYKQVGALVTYAKQQNKPLKDLELAELRKFAPAIDRDLYPRLDYKELVASYDHLGGSAPKRVRAAAAKARTATRKLLRQQKK